MTPFARMVRLHHGYGLPCFIDCERWTQNALVGLFCLDKRQYPREVEVLVESIQGPAGTASPWVMKLFKFLASDGENEITKQKLMDELLNLIRKELGPEIQERMTEIIEFESLKTGAH